MNSNTSPRLSGLDTLRALAIILVLIYHYRVVAGTEDSFGFLSQLGWTGVDSWSLCIEEQFYLIFSLIALVFFYARKSIALV
jgi:peptidoglycan/LPS O-acetylase OafA/YrhL